MAYFKWAYNLYGGHEPLVREFPIASATAIEYGEVVQLSGGKVIAVADPTDFDDPVLGVAAEPHDGSTAGRQSGTKIKVICNPDAVFELHPTNVLTATGGSTTTFVDSSLLPATDDLFIGSVIEVVTCAAGIPAGTLIKVTDSTGATGTLTFATQAAAFAAGDTVKLYPGPYLVGQYGYDMTSDGTDINFETSGGESLMIVETNPDKKVVWVSFRLHQFGNDAAAK